MTRRKFWDIDHPPVVVLVGEQERTSPLSGALGDGTDYRVETVPDGDRAVDRIGERPAVECCWIAGSASVESDLDLVDAIAAADPQTTVVYAPEAGESGEQLAERATGRGASEYVAPDAGIGERRARVERAVERAIDRRHDARKRSAFDALLAELDASLFAKDERARHVLYPPDVTRDDGGELFGATDLEAFSVGGETAETTHRDDRSVIRNGERILGTVEHYPEAEGTWQRTSKVPWTVDGETVGVVGMTLDVSDWKHRERELLQRLGYLQRIPKYLTHDLRNPLAIARGYVQLARDGDPGALDTVEDALDRMSQKLTEFHGIIARGEHRDTTRSPVELSAVVEEVWGHVSLPGTELRIEVPEDATILADREQLRPLLQNVFRNAIDHAGPRVTVRVALLDDGFAIGDDGPGLADVAAEDLFATGTTTDEHAAGIGLAIVREVAHAHGWSVDTSESELGGASFRFRNCTIGRPVDRRPAGDPITLGSAVDVGNVGVPGAVDRRGDAVTLRGNGANVWGTVNEFHFLHAAVEGDVRLQARVAGMDVASERSKAGAMIRSGTDAGAAYAGICRMADRVPELLWRREPGDGGHSRQIEGMDDLYDWIATERVGGEIVCSFSADGDEWTVVDCRSVALDATASVGLFVCSAVDDESIEARFEDVDVHLLR